MPRYKEVTKLQASAQEVVAHNLRRLCCDRGLTVQEMLPAVQYVQAFLPPQIQAAVCHSLLHSSSKIVFPELLNHKYLMVCTQLNSDYLWINDSQSLLPLLGEFDGSNITRLKTTSSHSHQDPEIHAATNLKFFDPLYHYFGTLANLTCLTCSQLCNNYLLYLLSITCPHVEEISVEMCTEVDDEGVYSLVGYHPTTDTFAQIRRGVRLPTKSVCTKLKKVYFDYTLVCMKGAVMLLHMCPDIEDLRVSPDVSIGDVFTTMYGTNPENFEGVTAQYSLKILLCNVEIDEYDLALIVKTCPHLKEVSLRCNGVQRKDRNLLANLLSHNITSLHVMNCNMDAFLWYVQQRGKNLTDLTLQHLSMVPASLTFTRVHLQEVIRKCPNLQKFSLKLYNAPILQNVPYSSFGSSLCHFKSLSHLVIEGVTICTQDLFVLVSKCKNIQELHILIHNLNMLEDQVLYELLATGSLHNIEVLYLLHPMLTLAGLRRLLDECPHLHTVGPLSSWAISKKDRESLANEIRTKNWNLNIERPEIMNMFIL